METKNNEWAFGIGYILSIPILWIFLGCYKALFCWLSESINVLGLVCRNNWHDGLFFCISFTIAKMIDFEKENTSAFSVFIKSIIIYVLIYGLFAFPYMIVSFSQDLKAHTLLHFILLFFAVEESIEKLSFDRNK